MDFSNLAVFTYGTDVLSQVSECCRPSGSIVCSGQEYLVCDLGNDFMKSTAPLETCLQDVLRKNDHAELVLTSVSAPPVLYCKSLENSVLPTVSDESAYNVTEAGVEETKVYVTPHPVQRVEDSTAGSKLGRRDAVMAKLDDLVNAEFNEVFTTASAEDVPKIEKCCQDNGNVLCSGSKGVLCALKDSNTARQNAIDCAMKVDSSLKHELHVTEKGRHNTKAVCCKIDSSTCASNSTGPTAQTLDRRDSPASNSDAVVGADYHASLERRWLWLLPIIWGGISTIIEVIKTPAQQAAPEAPAQQAPCEYFHSMSLSNEFRHHNLLAHCCSEIGTIRCFQRDQFVCNVGTSQSGFNSLNDCIRISLHEAGVRNFRSCVKRVAGDAQIICPHGNWGPEATLEIPEEAHVQPTPAPTPAPEPTPSTPSLLKLKFVEEFHHFDLVKHCTNKYCDLRCLTEKEAYCQLSPGADMFITFKNCVFYGLRVKNVYDEDLMYEFVPDNGRISCEGQKPQSVPEPNQKESSAIHAVSSAMESSALSSSMPSSAIISSASHSNPAISVNRSSVQSSEITPSPCSSCADERQSSNAVSKVMSSYSKSMVSSPFPASSNDAKHSQSDKPAAPPVCDGNCENSDKPAAPPVCDGECEKSEEAHSTNGNPHPNQVAGVPDNSNAKKVQASSADHKPNGTDRVPESPQGGENAKNPLPTPHAPGSSLESETRINQHNGNHETGKLQEGEGNASEHRQEDQEAGKPLSTEGTAPGHPQGGRQDGKPPGSGGSGPGNSQGGQDAGKPSNTEGSAPTNPKGKQEAGKPPGSEGSAPGNSQGGQDAGKTPGKDGSAPTNPNQPHVEHDAGKSPVKESAAPNGPNGGAGMLSIQPTSAVRSGAGNMSAPTSLASGSSLSQATASTRVKLKDSESAASAFQSLTLCSIFGIVLISAIF